MQHKIDPQQHSEKLKDNITLQAVSMAFGTMASRVLGLLRDQAFAAMFDRTVTDAWTVAFRLPNMFRRLLGEGSLSVSFIPVFVEARTLDESGVRAKNLVNSFYSVLLIVLSCLTAVGIIFAPQIIRLITAAYGASDVLFHIFHEHLRFFYGDSEFPRPLCFGRGRADFI